MAQALVHVEVAQCAGVAGLAVAPERAGMIDADAVAADGRRLAFVDVDLAVRPVPAARALAVVFGGAAIVARGAILARSERAPAAAAAHVVRANALSVLARHRLQAVGRVARFQSFASFAIEAGRANAHGAVGAARAAVETRAIVQRDGDRVAALRSGRIRHTALAADALRVEWTFARARWRVLAEFTGESRLADALDAADAVFAIDARAAVAARLRCARVHRLLAVRAGEIQRTLADVAAVRVVARAAVQARIGQQAFVHVVLAQRARVAGAGAIALEAAHLIDAQPVVLARLRLTIVAVHFATRSHETFDALALDFGAAGRHFARAVVEARLALAQRMHANLRLAVSAGETRRAVALVVPATVFGAGSAVFARLRLTRRSGVDFAILARVAWRAMAFVAVRARDACAVRHARIVLAPIDGRAHEDVLIGARSLHQRTRPEHRHLRVHGARVEYQARAVQHAARVGGTQNENGRFVASLLVGEEERVVRGVRDHRPLPVNDEVQISESIQELQRVPSIVQQIGWHA